jgi:hypothetical protein
LNAGVPKLGMVTFAVVSVDDREPPDPINCCRPTLHSTFLPGPSDRLLTFSVREGTGPLLTRPGGHGRTVGAMSSETIRPAYSLWPAYNRRLRDAIAGMTGEQLAMCPSPDRWPLWASIGHLACQRVFWLCDFAGEPGAETTPFTNAGYDCPGDDDLEHVLGAKELVAALDATFAIVERCLDTWTLPMLEEEIRRPDFGDDWVHTRGAVLQRVFSHDVWHTAELNEALGIAGLPRIDLWN